MEEIKETLTQFNTTLAALVGQMASVKEDIRKISEKVAVLESEREKANPVIAPSKPLTAARNEYELKEIAILPDSVKELQVFEGEFDNYASWIGRAEGILKDYQIIKDRPLYRSIVLHIRQKIRGNAETALISYNVPDDDWYEIKRILKLHYADKRDLRTLEHQMGQMTQGVKTVDAFYTAVNNHFALIIRNLKSVDQNPGITDALIEMYRHRALDVFIRGLNGDISKLLIIRGPKTLPEAYAICLELQNVTTKVHMPNPNRFLPPAHPHQGYRPESGPRYPWGFQPSQPAPQLQQHSQRFSNPRPAIKMESNQSGQSYRSNISAQGQGSTSFKRSHSTSSNLNPFRKSQRLYQLNDLPPSVPTSSGFEEKQNDELYYGEARHGNVAILSNCPPQVDDRLRPEGDFGNRDEINFMAEASLAFHS